MRPELKDLIEEDPQPRPGYHAGDVVCISVDGYGLTGRDPHPPMISRTRGMPYSPCTIGVVAYLDVESNTMEHENTRPEEDFMFATDYYYVATNVGFYVFAHYELQPASIGNIENLKEPDNLPAVRSEE